MALCRGGCATTSFSATGERANNPYCIYQLELQDGIEPKDTEAVKFVLQKAAEQEMAAEEA